MPLQEPLVDARLQGWIICLRLDFIDDTTNLESVASRYWLRNVTDGSAYERLLSIGGNVFHNKRCLPIRVTTLCGDFFHRHAVFTYSKYRFLCGIARFQFDHFHFHSRQQ